MDAAKGALIKEIVERLEPVAFALAGRKAMGPTRVGKVLVHFLKDPENATKKLLISKIRCPEAVHMLEELAADSGFWEHVRPFVGGQFGRNIPGDDYLSKFERDKEGIEHDLYSMVYSLAEKADEAMRKEKSETYAITRLRAKKQFRGIREGSIVLVNLGKHKGVLGLVLGDDAAQVEVATMDSRITKFRLQHTLLVCQDKGRHRSMKAAFRANLTAIISGLSARVLHNKRRGRARGPYRKRKIRLPVF